MPASPLRPRRYAQLCIRQAVQFSRDAQVLLRGKRYAGAVMACQHAWEMVGKAALAIESGTFVFPPPRSQKYWMKGHDVLLDVRLNCQRFAVAPGSQTEVVLQNLERWLPPPASDPNPRENTEYFHDDGQKWRLPCQFFRARHAKAALREVRGLLGRMRTVFPRELGRISIAVH